MKTIGNIRKLFLLLALIVAGAQSAWAFDYKGKVEYDKAEYYIYSSKSLMGDDFYTASLANITGTGDVVIPSSFEYTNWDNGLFHYYGKAYVGAAGWWYDQQKAEDITCSADITSLLFEGAIEIHGHFKLQNLYGSLSFSPLWSHSTILSDATLDIPHVNVLNCYSLQVDGTILAPALQKLTLQSSTTVNGTITAANATQAIIGGTVNASGKVNAPAATQLNISQGAKVFGSIYAMATKVNIASGTQVTGLLNVPVATNIVMDANSFSGTISSNSLTSITLRQTNFGTSGKLQCSGLRDIYIPSKTALPTFYGQYSDHFTAPSGSITVHVYDMTANEIAAMKNSVVWNGFKQIVNHKSEVSYTLTNNSMATVSFLGKDGGYDAPTNESQYAQVISGSKTGTVKAERDYSVEIRDIDFDTKTVTLKRNGQSVALKSSVNQGLPVRYYDDLDLQQDVRYEVSVSDLTCDIDFAQQVYTGRIMYQKTLNGSNSTGVISSQTARVTCTRGSRLKLTIPYDPTSYTPNKLYMGGSEVTMTKANGEATATITVPTAASADVLLTWLEPEPIVVVVVPDPEEPEQTVTEPAHHQPKITIVRSGEGNIQLKGLCNLYDDQQSIDAYEQEFGYDAQNGWVVNAVANCTDDVTTVTVPDVDYLGRGGYLDMIDWGFEVNITPVAGQTVKSLMMGWIVTDDDNRQYIEWESFSTTGAYLNDDDGDGTFTFSFAGDEMSWWIGDYIVNIVMGPEETAVETGATLNFVRQGGRTEVLFEKEDVDGTLTDQVIGEGSMSFNLKYFTEAELEDAGMNYYQLLWFNPVEGETIHVFCDGTDITSQLIYNSETGNARLDLERKNHTYTLLIDDAPDANPTWSIHNATEGDVVVEQTLKDGTTTTTTFTENFNELVIDDSSVSKVSLKVYLNAADISSSLRVERNGVDVTYQSTSVEGDSNGNWVTYEVPADQLIDATWNISNNTDRAQTFIVTGGTTEQVVEMAYEYLYNEPTLHAKNDGVPVTAYLPPYDSDKNTQVNLKLYVKNEERVTVLRNGVDVTNAFTKHDGYYEIGPDDYHSLFDTREALGFQINDPAVWKITIRSLTDQIKTINIANPDGMDITYTRNYTDGQTIDGSISEAYRQIFFDDSDRENTSSVYLKVPIKDANYQYYPVRVLCNGEDVTYQYSNFDPDGYLIYETNVGVDQTWDISRDVSHRQTFIRKGGTTWNVEVEFDFPVDGYERYFYPDQIGTPLYVDFPAYHPNNAPYAYITIDVEEGSTFTVLRNGVEVTKKFVATNGAGSGFTRYMLSEADNGGSDTQAALGFQFRDPAVWQITIGDTGRYDLNNDNKVDISDVTKLVNKVLNR